MAGDLSPLREGLNPYAVVVRLSQTADRLHDLADDAEERGRLADATRATLAEAKTLHLLLTLGVRGSSQIEQAGDAAALEASVVALVAMTPDVGDRLGAQLEQRGREALAAKVRTYAQKCRAVSENEQRQELTNA